MAPSFQKRSARSRLEDALRLGRGGAEEKCSKTLAPQATFKKSAEKKKAPKGSDPSHPDAMSENGNIGEWCIA